ncbi:MAG TPA: protein kinase, partial [Pirellulales bacterium]
MASEFNPLEQWLGISAVEQPATYYRLLGLADFERDPAAISRAAKARISQLKGIDPGVQQATMQTLIKTVAAVGAHLLDAEKKTAYDVDLQTKQFNNKPGNPGSAAQGRDNRSSNLSADELRGGGRKIERLNDYLIVARLGNRAGERVFKAEDQNKPRTVALKILPTKLINDNEATARFARVVEAAAQLSHRNLIALYGTGQDRGLNYLAMEYIDGCDLERFLAERGPLQVGAGIDIM